MLEYMVIAYDYENNEVVENSAGDACAELKMHPLALESIKEVHLNGFEFQVKALCIAKRLKLKITFSVKNPVLR